MENAAKALLIAGGIFFVIMIMTFGVYTYVKLHNIAKAQDELTEKEQLVAFNKKYESYNKTIMYGTDLITLMNMTKEDNEKYDIDISITFTIVEPIVYTKDLVRIEDPVTHEVIYRRGQAAATFSGTYDMSAYRSQIKGNKDMFDDFKRRLFKCTGTAYSTDGSGRIASMSFVEVPLTDYKHK